MLEIADWIHTTLSGDATLLGLLGGDAADTRIVDGFPDEEFILDNLDPAIISIYEAGPAAEIRTLHDNGFWKPGEEYAIDVWANDTITMDQVADRVDLLLNQKQIPAQTTFLALGVDRTFKGRIPDDNPKIFRKSLRFGVTGIHSLTAL